MLSYVLRLAFFTFRMETGYSLVRLKLHTEARRVEVLLFTMFFLGEMAPSPTGASCSVVGYIQSRAIYIVFWASVTISKLASSVH